MNKKRDEKIGKKTISLFEIFVMMISIIAFAYFIGDEFRVVRGAVGITTPKKVVECFIGTKIIDSRAITYIYKGSGKWNTYPNPIEKDFNVCTDPQIAPFISTSGECRDGYFQCYETGGTTTPTTTEGCKLSDGYVLPSGQYGCDLAGQNRYNCKCDDGTQTGQRWCTNGKLGNCVYTKKEQSNDKNLGTGEILKDGISFLKPTEQQQTICATTCTGLGNLGGACKNSCGTNEEELPGLCGTQGTGTVCCCTKSQTTDGTTGEDQQKAKTPEEQANDKLLGDISIKIGALVAQLGIALAIYGVTQALKLIPGSPIPPEAIDQISLALSIGYGAGSTIAILAGTVTEAGTVTFFGGTAFTLMGVSVPVLGLIGLGIGAIIGLFTAEDERIIAISYSCNQWQPPAKGEDCEECNKGQFLCTKYKCESLGKACRLVNEGTDEEQCTWVDKNDIEPPAIVSSNAGLRENFYYDPESARLTPTQTGDSGVSVKYNGPGADAENCIPPYTILKLGVSLTDGTGKPKLGHCKYDIVRTDKFEEMKYNMNNLWDTYNHTLTMIHGNVDPTVEGINLPNGANYEIYLRCESTNGYSNVGTFVFKYCVSAATDTEAPQIILTTPLNGMPVAFGAGENPQETLVYVNKPSECKWSRNNEDYETMPETMVCDQTMGTNLLYRCTTSLSGLLDSQDNLFYFNCKSHPEYQGTDKEIYRRSMAQSYEYKLTGTQPLVIDYVKPEHQSLIKGSTDVVGVTLQAHTSAGYKDGTAWCFFKETADTSYDLNCNLNGPGLFSNTNSFEHSQELSLSSGGYNYQIKCCDLGGNSDTKDVSFTVETDRESPTVTRVYNDNKKLKLITDEEAECVYDMTDCSYSFNDGIKMATTNKLEHTTDWNTNGFFYVKCKDTFANEPRPNECSMIVRPFSGY